MFDGRFDPYFDEAFCARKRDAQSPKQVARLALLAWGGTILVVGVLCLVILS